MWRKPFFVAIILLLGVTADTEAGRADLIAFDLALAGYRVGMSYDEALLVRPLDYLEQTIGHSADSPYLVGHAGSITIDEFNTDFWSFSRATGCRK